MHGGLSILGLKKLEEKIDLQLNGRDAKSIDLEQDLRKLVDDYSFEVEYYNTLHSETPYLNKYGTTTPLNRRPELSLANLMVNGVPTEKSTADVPQGKYSISPETMHAFKKSFESFLTGKPSADDVKMILSFDPNPNAFSDALLSNMKTNKPS